MNEELPEIPLIKMRPFWEVDQLHEEQRRVAEYLEAIEPLVRERVALASAYARVSINCATGDVTVVYPPEIRVLDAKYLELMQQMRRQILGEGAA